MLFGVAGMAQPRLAIDALLKFQNGDVSGAQQLIDTAITVDDCKNDPITWTYRGYIYKGIYKANEKQDKNSPARVIAIDSYKKALTLTDTGQAFDQSLQDLGYLVKTLYNDAVRSLNARDAEQALKSYAEFKDLKTYLDPNYNFKKEDVQFYNVLASTIYSVLYDEDREKNAAYFDKAIEAYGVVLAIDSNDYNANYNTAVLFYNKGVNKIKALDPESPIPIIVSTQDECVVLFKKALPYMLKAYELNPKRREVLIGLSGIYFSLNEIEKSNYYSKLLEELDK